MDDVLSVGGAGVAVLTFVAVAVAVLTWAATVIGFTGVGVLVSMTSSADTGGESASGAAGAVDESEGCSQEAAEDAIRG